MAGQPAALSHVRLQQSRPTQRAAVLDAQRAVALLAAVDARDALSRVLSAMKAEAAGAASVRISPIPISDFLSKPALDHMRRQQSPSRFLELRRLIPVTVERLCFLESLTDLQARSHSRLSLVSAVYQQLGLALQAAGNANRAQGQVILPRSGIGSSHSDSSVHIQPSCLTGLPLLSCPRPPIFCLRAVRVCLSVPSQPRLVLPMISHRTAAVRSAVHVFSSSILHPRFFCFSFSSGFSFVRLAHIRAVGPTSARACAAWTGERRHSASVRDSVLASNLCRAGTSARACTIAIRDRSACFSGPCHFHT
jgi:hypothetical protein